MPAIEDKPYSNQNVAKALNACEPMESPRMETSDKLKQIIKELHITEELLNDTMWNVCLERRERDEKIPEPQCMQEAISSIESMVYWIKHIAEKLHFELK